MPSCSGDIEFFLPGLESADYQITSSADPDYNCIAWALGETDRWWSPSPQSRDYWPDQLPRGDSVETVARAFALAGFERCDTPDLEPGVEKIALFADEGRFLHVARQLASGGWTSKIGKNCDIEHDLNALTSRRSPFPSYRYGEVVGFMQRPLRQDALETADSAEGE